MYFIISFVEIACFRILVLGKIVIISHFNFSSFVVFFNFNNLNQFKLFFSGRKLIKNDSVKNRRFWYYLFITNEPFEISEKFYNFLVKNVRSKYHETINNENGPKQGKNT